MALKLTRIFSAFRGNLDHLESGNFFRSFFRLSNNMSKCSFLKFLYMITSHDVQFKPQSSRSCSSITFGVEEKCTETSKYTPT